MNARITGIGAASASMANMCSTGDGRRTKRLPLGGTTKRIDKHTSVGSMRPVAYAPIVVDRKNIKVEKNQFSVSLVHVLSLSENTSEHASVGSIRPDSLSDPCPSDSVFYPFRKRSESY